MNGPEKTPGADRSEDLVQSARKYRTPPPFTDRSQALAPDDCQPDPPRSRILVTGARGFVGTSLLPYLLAREYLVLRLVRLNRNRPSGLGGGTTAPPGRNLNAIPWDPAGGVLDPRHLEGLDAVIHLAGENVGAGRWTAQSKERIFRSRVAGTRLLAERLAGLSHRPEVLVCASAIGFYGDRGDEMIDEESGPGSGFFASVVQAWEAAAAPARAAGIRVVHLRMGVVLAPHGGALARMLPMFRLGLGTRFGHGRQYFSWIALDDLLAAFGRVLAVRAITGPVNATAPGSVTNAEFTRTLAGVVGRPAPLAIPAWVLRLALGEMAEEMLLTGVRVRPTRLLSSGFTFEYPELEPALRHLFGNANV